MTPFRQIPLNVQETEANHRRTLLSLPDELFREQFDGRIPGQHEKLKWIDETVKELNPERLYQNDTYWVGFYRRPPYIHLDIHRLDGGTCKEWRDFQQIKNELVGPEFEALELFPAESRLVDTANQYHLWVLADPTSRFSVGWWGRHVLGKQESVSALNSGMDSCAGQMGVVHSSARGVTLLPSSV